MDRGGIGLQLGLGVATQSGRRQRNEDFAGAILGSASQRASHGVAAAIADGMGGAKGGREAAELVVRGFLDGYYGKSETLGVQRAASQVMDSLNRWICSMGRNDAGLAGMGCTFTGLVLRGRTAHVLHVGDTRLYRLTGERLLRLTEDHTLSQPELTHILYRAIGIEETMRLDYSRHSVDIHDRFMLCCDGVHGVLSDTDLSAILGRRTAPEDAANDIIAEALAAGSSDNVTALVIDVIALPPVDQVSLGTAIASLPIAELPKPGDVVDGFRIETLLSDGRYSRLFIAEDSEDGNRVVLKFPHPRVTTEVAYKAAFIREAWVAARVRSPWVGRVMELPPDRQTRLYTIMPFYDGQTLERRLDKGKPLTLEEGREIGIRLAKAVSTLHRNGIIHRDIKPDNVILEHQGSLKLVDLGVALIPGMDEFPQQDIPGTASFMAPELFAGEQGDEKSDLYALGVTLFRALTGAYPYGEVEPFTRPRFGKPAALTKLRPDLPVWFEAVLSRAIAIDPADRHGDVMELAIELENGPVGSLIDPRRPVPLYDRNPLLFWKVVSALLAIIIGAMAFHRHV